MDTELEKVIAEQATKLPKEIRNFFASSDWDISLDAIINEFSIPETVRSAVRNEVVIVLLGLMHPDALREELGKIILTRKETIDAIVAQIETRILTPIRPALVQFFEEERTKDEPVETAKEAPSVGAAPANIPTAIKEEPLIPTLIPKVITPQAPAPEIILMHPFEEKLQKAPASVVTPAPTSAMPATFTPAPTSPIPAVPQTPLAPQGAVAFTPAPNGSSRGTLTHDPYREPLE
ncbi:MAG: hypothetical protein A2937_00360 [Candidatus Yonathbacteria bacterium RIFCSPLOWO2_01_FULL_47_33b]|uniref:Uncharacterized protein n=1 Tax=Candidatus Yonathbacteria bacterium RIFCSPLOWO2_01_FULL_47_33b TaxID=1802727 RepID=A0A1G2SGM6_9BACT|nr:MAG: hypothetical protein A2937_00360 [Candidatus Yonathbacteria bacterium RIFCSPLOWO2_01_FULL_47_33b]